MFNVHPEREFVMLVIDAWGHHDGTRSSTDKFKMKATVKKFFLTLSPSPAPSTPGGASNPIPQGDPFERSWGGAHGLEAGRSQGRYVFNVAIPLIFGEM